MSDMHEKLPLELLDPGFSDPGFWSRFRARALAGAAGELARRRGEVELDVVDVVFAWRRALVPLALLAAALAGVLLVSQGEPIALPSPAALEEVLLQGVAGGPVSWEQARESELDEVAFLTMSRR